MKKRRTVSSAILKQVLVYYDGPQLVLLESNRKLNMLAVAVERQGMEEAFFACELRDKEFNKYISGKADLHYAFNKAALDRYYFFDLCDLVDGAVEIIDASAADAMNEAFWPEVGFFSRDHTEPLVDAVFKPSAKHVFNIDGNWEASEFSRFYTKLADLYAFFAMMNRFDDPQKSNDEKKYIAGSIRSRLWQGGGSYVGFYDDLLSHIQSIMPLQVSRIQYASPGQIEVSGESDVFSDIDETIDKFSENPEKIAEQYKVIDRILSKEKLKKANKDAEFSSKAQEAFVRKRALRLARNMKIERRQDVLAACGNNTLIFSKVMLSFYRRARDLHNFYAEARVQSVSETEIEEAVPRRQD